MLLEIGKWVGADQSPGGIQHTSNGRAFTYTLANYRRGFEYM